MRLYRGDCKGCGPVHSMEIKPPTLCPACCEHKLTNVELETSDADQGQEVQQEAEGHAEAAQAQAPQEEALRPPHPREQDEGTS